MGKIISLDNQKGGVGKSTLTNILASYIHTHTDYSVIVIDGDFLQETMSDIRNKELSYILKLAEKQTVDAGSEWNETIKQLVIDDYLKKVYKLVTRDTKNIAQSLVDYRDEYDFVFVDLPGNLSAEGVISVVAAFDVIFVPTDVSYKDLMSTKRFLQMYDERVKPIRTLGGHPVNLYGIFNKVQENTVEFKNRMERVHELDIKIPFLNSYVIQTNRLKRDESNIEFTSMKGLTNENMLIDFCKEIIDIILNTSRNGKKGK